MLNRFISIFNKSFADIEENFKIYNFLCMNTRSGKHICQSCQEVCPVEGITLQENVKVEKCINCGLCAPACPTGVFDDLWHGFYKVLDIVKDSRPYIWINCHKTNVKDGLQVTCLGELTIELVFFMLQKDVGKVNIVYQPELCEECVCNYGQKTWENTWKKLIAMYPEETEKVKVISDIHSLKNDSNWNVDYSRRGFLRNISTESSNLFREVILRSAPNNIPQPFEQHLSLRRKLFLYMISNMEQKKVEEIELGYFNHPEINQNCNFCESCIRLCPSGALKLNKVDSKMDISINPAECNMCRLCENICPANAIVAYNTANNLNVSLHVNLARGIRYECSSCQNYYYDFLNTNNPQCPSCRNKKFKPEKLWLDN